MIKENQRIFNFLFAIFNALLCVLAMICAYGVRFYVLSGEHGVHFTYYRKLMAMTVPVNFLICQSFGLNDSFRRKNLISEIGKVIEVSFLDVIFVFLLSFLLKEVNVSRATVLLFGAFYALFSTAERVVVRKTLRALRRHGYNLKHIVIVGWTSISGDFCRRLMKNKNLGYWIDGYIAEKKADISPLDLPYLGDFSCLQQLLAPKGIDEVVVSLEEKDFNRLGHIIEICEQEGVKSSLLPFYTKYLPMRPYIDEVEGLPLINLRRVPLDNLLNSFVKRAFDVTASFLGLLILSPFLLGVAAGIKLTSPGPIIYKQERVGRSKKIFTMYKFRSMAVEGNADTTTWGTRDDPRRTRFGTFLRKYSIDELPQLYNVLRGDMSLVGPRPERPFFVEKFREEIPLYMIKHLVRPGITGWAQVNGWRGDTSIEKRIECDIHYIENWSFLLDIKILFLTVFRGFINQSEDAA